MVFSSTRWGRTARGYILRCRTPNGKRATTTKPALASGFHLVERLRVNAVAPGPISGNWEQEWGVDAQHIEEAKAMNPMKRFGDPREIAETSCSSHPTVPDTSTAK